MRSTLTIISVVALIALGAGPAAAQSDMSSGRADAAIHAQAMRAQGLHYQKLHSDQATVQSPGELAPARVAPAPSAGGGFDWVDAGIGAGLAAALLLTAAAVSTVRRHPIPAR